jgi:hypothetical protein
MTFTAIPQGASVFVDANIFISGLIPRGDLPASSCSIELNTTP